MRSTSARLFVFLALSSVTILLVFTGCNGDPLLARRPFGVVPKDGAFDSQTAQLQEFSRRISQLDTNNRDLHTEVARLQQDLQRRDQLQQALQKQLNDTANQLADMQSAKNTAEQQLASLRSSTQQRGGAMIKANSSLRNTLKVITIPGVDVRQDGDLIRVEMPSDRLFAPSSVQLLPAGLQLIDQVATSVSQNYPRQRIGVEGHTDASSLPAPLTNHHQLATGQAMAVFNQIIQSRRISSQQLFVLSHGTNHPLSPSGDPAGRARNRRVELVVYPETVQ